jgi:hypothetical protein
MIVMASLPICSETPFVLRPKFWSELRVQPYRDASLFDYPSHNKAPQVLVSNEIPAFQAHLELSHQHTLPSRRE